jgi:cephalosporin hydroxylase
MDEVKKITGHCLYKNLIVQQHEDVFEIFKNFLNEIRPKRILEIGTATGGFTLFLRDTLDELGLQDSKIRTFEINNHPPFSSLRERGVEILHDNIFDHSYFNLVKPELVEPFIKEEGTTLVLCDGGYKITEFKKLSPYLKNGDFIMAHDYAPNKEYFEQEIYNKVWLWCEIEDKYISEVFEPNNLVSYNQDEFQKVVWICKKKVVNE